MVSREILAWGWVWELKWEWERGFERPVPGMCLCLALITPHDVDCITRLFWNVLMRQVTLRGLCFYHWTPAPWPLTQTLGPQCCLGPVHHSMKFRRGNSCSSCSLEPATCWVEVCSLYFWSSVKPCTSSKTTTSERTEEPGPSCLFHEWAASRSTR